MNKHIEALEDYIIYDQIISNEYEEVFAPKLYIGGGGGYFRYYPVNFIKPQEPPDILPIICSKYITFIFHHC